MALTEEEVHVAIKRSAATISQQPLGLAHYRPRPDALPTNCIGNALAVTETNGGQIRYGWYFLLRRSLEHGHYLIATHHAVWHRAADLLLIDVTPFHPEEKHRPITQDGDPLFLVDDNAKPYTTSGFVIPLPSRFYAIDDNPSIQEYVARLQREEYESYNQQHGASFP